MKKILLLFLLLAVYFLFSSVAYTAEQFMTTNEIQIHTYPFKEIKKGKPSISNIQKQKSLFKERQKHLFPHIYPFIAIREYELSGSQILKFKIYSKKKTNKALENFFNSLNKEAKKQLYQNIFSYRYEQHFYFMSFDSLKIYQKAYKFLEKDLMQEIEKLSKKKNTCKELNEFYKQHRDKIIKKILELNKGRFPIGSMSEIY